ncbi:HD-GYP domain-containing protein [Hippea alviniae]|uniref:HD-GYP domain-containing protein n=1 Tax=Hippea alviniae TaxID=1279027 RepID=UPI0003B5B71C|nr:HD domain-containing phosphohydrolase [Hippea alviniae]
MDIKRVLFELSRLSDFIEGNDTFHQRRVAVIAFELARELKFDNFGLDLVLKSALIHDIALLNDTSKVETFRQIVYEEFGKLNKHATVSGRIARFFNLHLDITTAINLHHTPHGSNSSLIGSILFLADNIEVAHRSLTNPFAFDELFDFLKQKGDLFDDTLLDAFKRCSEKECFWFYLLDENVDDRIEEILKMLPEEEVDDKFKDALFYFLAYASDRIAPFFEGYSILTKNIATSLGYKLNLDVNRLKYAALSSHIGNLTVPFDVFKKESIDEVEYNIIKSHTLNAKRVLEKMGFDDLAQVVFAHHENIKNSGYPCKRLPSLESEVLGLSSFVAAMMQDRPYRAALSNKEIVNEIDKMSEKYHESVIKALKEIDFDKVRKTKDEYYDAVSKLFL